jgi:hypothetical protein
MSGFRNKSESDIIENRQEYLDNLNLEVQLNKIVENAVLEQQKTGQPNPVTAMRDTRSTTEKLADVEKLKIQLIKDLEPIAEPTFANMMIQKLIQSPLNTENKLFIFFAQRAEEIVKNLQKLYKYGIKGDVNDAEQFVNYINTMYSTQSSIFSSTKQLTSRLGMSSRAGTASIDNKFSSINVLLRDIAGDLKANYNILDDYIKSAKADYSAMARAEAIRKGYFDKLKELSSFHSKINNVLNQIIQYIDLYTYIYPHERDFISILEEIIKDPFNFEFEYDEFVRLFPARMRRTKTFDDTVMDISKYIKFINNNIINTDLILPNLKQINKIISNITKTKDRKLERLQEIIETSKVILNYYTNILNQLSTGVDISTLQEMKKISGELKMYYTKVRGKMPFDVEPIYAPNSEDGDDDDDDDDDDYDDDYPESKEEGTLRESKSDDDRKRITYKDDNNDEDNNNDEDDDKQSRPKITEKKREVYREVFNGKGRPRGSGLTEPKIERFKKSISQTEGIKPSPKFIQFGKYYINKHLLDDNTLSLRNDKGTQIGSLPSYKMTKGFGIVIRKIMGGSNPSYDELNSLTDEEKKYLHKVVKASKIADKVAIPTPSKDQEEKDIHRFNVLKGQLMAGNDSKEVIKEFKILALKLSRNNVLSKSSVNEILQDLLTMGY